MTGPIPAGPGRGGRLPPVHEQWRRLRPAVRVGIVVPPLVVTVLLLIVDLTVGIAVGVMVAGAAAATAVYAKNRTDRFNAALDRGEDASNPERPGGG